MTSGNDALKHGDQHQLQAAAAKMTSNPSPIENMNIIRQLEQESDICNKTPSQQRLRQKHFGSTKSDERRSTHCSSSNGPTDPNCDSSISSGGFNYCTDSISHNHQCQVNLQQAATLNSYKSEEIIMEASERCGLTRAQSGSSSSGASAKQTHLVSAGKLGDQNRITFSPDSQKSGPPRALSEPVKQRETWNKNIEFLLAVVGFAVDLGNVWRFPYICYRNGGGAFLIPYTIMFVLGGLPIFYLEMSLGQYFSSGCLTVWRRICPIAKGIGYAMCVLNFFTGLFYNTIISWAVFYFIESFTFNLPWTNCNNAWNSPNCRTLERRQEDQRMSQSNPNNTNPTVFTSPTKDYFDREVLKVHLSTGIDDLGSLRTPLMLYLAVVYVCVYFAIWKGVKSTGKAVWITALLPYFVLFPLLIRGIFLEGSLLGIKYYLSPNWESILNIDVWIDAAQQVFFSLGPGFGTLLALSSYNKFNHNCQRDALIAAAVNYFASFISGLVIFAVLGYMATIGNIDIAEVVSQGPGLVFQVYPEGLATMRLSSMWSISFFLMIISLGIDSTFGGLESVITGLCDEYPRVLRAHRGIFIGLLIVVIYICSLPTTTYGGNYVITLLETYGTSVSLLLIVTVETIVVCWLYGVDRFCTNLEEMHGRKPGVYWRVCWKYISPTLLILIFVADASRQLDVYRSELTIDNYKFPSWAPTVGLLMTGSSICCIPIYAAYYLKTKASGSFCERLRAGFTPEGQDITNEKDGNNRILDTDI